MKVLFLFSLALLAGCSGSPIDSGSLSSHEITRNEAQRSLRQSQLQNELITIDSQLSSVEARMSAVKARLFWNSSVPSQPGAMEDAQNMSARAELMSLEQEKSSLQARKMQLEGQLATHN
jgi:hypothetical protein